MRRLAMLGSCLAATLAAPLGCALPVATNIDAEAGAPLDNDGSAGGGGSGGAAPAVEHLVATVDSDEDDGMWYGCDPDIGAPDTNELLGDDGYLFLGTDAAEECSGLRFRLGELPAGARIVSSRLTVRAELPPQFQFLGASVRVRAWDAADVPPFQIEHHEPPTEHGGGVLADDVSWAIGEPGAAESPDLALLVQRIVDRPDWSESATLGFLLAPMAVVCESEIVCAIAFRDSTHPAGQAATLDVEWIP